MRRLDPHTQEPSTTGILARGDRTTKERVTPFRHQKQATSKHSDRPAATTAQVARLPANVSAAPTPQIIEEFRQIKRSLLVNAFGKGASVLENGNLITVTSALPAEGKSYTSLNLALNVALERNRTVLLVDADPVKRAVSKLFGLARATGLIDALLDDQRTPSQVIYRTNRENLSVIPCGTQHAHVTELLASDRTENLIADLSQRYPNQIIIFDAPPLLATTETQILARFSGQIVLVVEAGRTSHQTVHEAIGTLNDSKAVSLVLNKCQPWASRNYYCRTAGRTSR